MTDQTPPRPLDGEWKVPTYDAPTSPVNAPGIGTRSPSVRLPHDEALRQLGDALERCRVADVRTSEIVHRLLTVYRGQTLGGPRERIEADVVGAILTAPVSPIATLVGMRVQGTALLRIARHRDPYVVDVTPLPAADLEDRLYRAVVARYEGIGEAWTTDESGDDLARAAAAAVVSELGLGDA